MFHLDGHEVGIVTTLAGFYTVTNGIFHKGWVKSMIHRQPVVAMSLFLGCVGISLPIIVVPIRRRLGFPTNQYDATFPGTVFPTLEE